MKHRGFGIERIGVAMGTNGKTTKVYISKEAARTLNLIDLRSIRRE